MNGLGPDRVPNFIKIRLSNFAGVKADWWMVKQKIHKKDPWGALTDPPEPKI